MLLLSGKLRKFVQSCSVIDCLTFKLMWELALSFCYSESLIIKYGHEEFFLELGHILPLHTHTHKIFLL